MGFLKKILLPLIVFVGVGGVTILSFDKLEFGSEVLLYALGIELLFILYYWDFQLNKSKKSGLFYIYLTILVLFDWVFSIVLIALRATGIIELNVFYLVFWIITGLSVLVSGLLKLTYGGVNDSIKNQAKGEHGLAKMKDICRETMFVLEQYKKDATIAIKVLKEVEEALEYSDPVSHKNVYGIEKQIVSALKTAKKHAKNKLFGKVNKVMKDSNGVLYLIKKRNTILRDSK
jgi:hypothetical protein